MSDITAVYGLVDAAEADATVVELEALGLHPEEIDIRVPEPGRYRLADESLHEEARGARRGALAGAAVGLLVGMAAGTLFFDSLGMVGVLLIGFAGSSFGILIGGMAGLEANDDPDDDPVVFRSVDRDSSLRLVEVHCLHWRNKAHKILESHGAVLLDDGRPASA